MMRFRLQLEKWCGSGSSATLIKCMPCCGKGDAGDLQLSDWRCQFRLRRQCCQTS
jgi:hypothetical protein